MGNEFMEAAFSERTENKVSVIMLDVDDFKAINEPIRPYLRG